MNSPTHRSKLSLGAIIVISLLLVVGAIFLVAVHRQVQANGSTFVIDLNLAPEVVEFEDFINYGSPIQASGTDASGNPVIVLTESRVDRPIFTKMTLASRMKFWWREWSLAAKQVLQNQRAGQTAQGAQAAPAP
jgi:hypothetical protein